jgi:hypothetical protein
MATYSLYENERSRIDIDSTLSSSFQRAGTTHGFKQVSAAFHPYKEFKATWQRTGDRAEFLITDYMDKADPSLLDDFANCLFKRVGSKHRGEIYSPRMKDWLQSSDFVRWNRPIYLKRSRNLAHSHEGASYDLSCSYKRLMVSGLIDDLPDHYLTWTKKPNVQRMGYCSVLMRVIAISSALDSPKVPEFVTDYVLYHELLHLEDGLKAIGSHHDQQFRMREREYPQWRDAESWLKKVAMKKV